ncbi:triose-phosphate isomerase [Ornithinimicrobium sp. W1679]|uniref:triose-phosphate isomerase n=1 Tax=Ornithinimicrobium sp. W1679 TaxID=3418770 RepID=UPI003CED4B53
MRQTWIGTSWKMTKTLAESSSFARGLAARAHQDGWAGVQPFVIPPSTSLRLVADVLDGSGVLVGAQNAHWEDEGAWTGEVSVPLVVDAGARLVEIGHSERRTHFGETDETVRLKVSAALRHGCIPLLCVGEPEEVFARGGSTAFVLAQVEAAMRGLGPDEQRRVIVAYEPVWAIGEHGRAARPEDVSGVFEQLAAEFGSRVRALLYGGSVDAGNAARTLEVPHVHGLFVGRAAWTLPGFLKILDIAVSHGATCGST